MKIRLNELREIQRQLKDASLKEENQDERYELACRWLETKFLGDLMIDKNRKRRGRKGK